MAKMTRGRYTSGIVGCVADLVLDEDYRVRLDQVLEPTVEGAVNVAVCG